MKSKIGTFLRIKIEYAQIKCGSLLQFWELDYTTYSPTLTGLWVEAL